MTKHVTNQPAAASFPADLQPQELTLLGTLRQLSLPCLFQNVDSGCGVFLAPYPRATYIAMPILATLFVAGMMYLVWTQTDLLHSSVSATCTLIVFALAWCSAALGPSLFWKDAEQRLPEINPLLYFDRQRDEISCQGGKVCVPSKQVRYLLLLKGISASTWVLDCQLVVDDPAHGLQRLAVWTIEDSLLGSPAREFVAFAHAAGIQVIQTKANGGKTP